MFNWVCPRCGRDVPPSKTECPFCAPPVSEPTAPPPQQFQPPPPPQYAQQPPPPQYAPPQQYGQPPQQYPPPPQYAPPQQPQYAPPQQYAQPPQYAPPQQYPPQQYAPQPPQYWQPEAPPLPPPAQQPEFVPQQYVQQAPPQYAQPQYAPPVPVAPFPPVEMVAPPAPSPHSHPPAEHAHWPAEKKPGMPLWLIGVLTAIGFLVVFAVLYYVTQGSHGSSADKGGDSAASASRQSANPNQKYVEVVGVRIMSQKGTSVARFVVISHSGVELTDITANVNLWASTKHSEEDSVGSFTFSLPSLGAGESKEITAPFKSKMAPSDIPDWQNITADVQMTTPQ